MKLAAATLVGALVFAGCVSTGATDAPLDESAATTLAPAPIVSPFEASGSTFTGVGACVPVFCYGVGAPSEGSDWFEPELEGNLTAVDLTLTWSATTPATEELLLGIAYETEDEMYDWVYATGASPLVLSKSGLDIPAERIYAIYVNAFRCAGDAVYGCASAEQPFSIEGTLTTLATQ